MVPPLSSEKHRRSDKHRSGREREKRKTGQRPCSRERCVLGQLFKKKEHEWIDRILEILIPGCMGSYGVRFGEKDGVIFELPAFRRGPVIKRR
jgi:hypothetical protein